MQERNFGEPVRLHHNQLFDLRDEFVKGMAESSGLDYSTIQLPDHIASARLDCTYAFLEEGLLPTVRDRVGEISSEELYEIANYFLTYFREAHPQDFNLNDPDDILDFAMTEIFHLSMVYEVLAKRSPKNEQIFDLLQKADQVLENAEGHEETDEDDEDTIEDENGDSDTE
jgi:hypothetical protein